MQSEQFSQSLSVRKSQSLHATDPPFNPEGKSEATWSNNNSLVLSLNVLQCTHDVTPLYSYSLCLWSLSLILHNLFSILKSCHTWEQDGLPKKKKKLINKFYFSHQEGNFSFVHVLPSYETVIKHGDLTGTNTPFFQMFMDRGWCTVCLWFSSSVHVPERGDRGFSSNWLWGTLIDLCYPSWSKR